MSTPPGRYVHGTSPEEQDRLALLNRILNDSCLREIGLSGGERIVDFGAGMGQFTRAMALAAGTGARVVGIERSAEQIVRGLELEGTIDAQAPIEFRRGDVYEPPLREDEWGTFDVAHARFLLEHVADPMRVVTNMVRAVRRGGRIVLADDDHDLLRFWPEPPGMIALWNAYVETYARAGNDAIVGRRLAALLHEAGARPRRTKWIWFGGCAGSDVFPLLITNLSGILRGARRSIAATGLISDVAIDSALAALAAWAGRPDAAIWFAVSWAEGVKPES